MTHAIARRLLLVLALALATAGPCFADDSDCLECHADPDFATDGMTVLDRERIAASVHAQVGCTTCHEASEEGGFDVVPHRMEGDGPPACTECHDEFEELTLEYEASVHALKLDSFSCTTCHDPHTMVGHRANLSRAERVTEGNRACLRCHRGSVRKTVQLKRGEPETPFHAWLPEPEKHRRMRCIVCHTPLEGEDPHRILSGEESVRDCSACHDVDAPLIRKYVGADDRSTWVTNPLVFEQAYVPGATRNRLADGILVALLSLTVLGILIHGLLRVAARRKRPAKPYAVERSFLFPLGVRVLHWANAVLILILIVTGLRIHFGAKFGPIVSFETAFNVHNLAATVLIVLAILFFLHGALTGGWRQYLSRHPAGRAGLGTQTRWYLAGIFRGEAHPYHAEAARRFNPLQQVAYAGVMYIALPLIVVTGLLLFWPRILPSEVLGHPGAWWIATLHYLLAWAVLLFLVGHLYLITTGDRLSYLLTSMFTGWHRHHRPAEGGDAS